MREITLKGCFWLVGRPDDIISGTYTFDEKGARLYLDGVFLEARDRKGTFTRVLGLVEGSKITLDQCLLHSYKTDSSQYRSIFVYVGEHFDSERKLEFVGAKMHLRYFKDWVGQTDVTPGRLPTPLEILKNNNVIVSLESLKNNIPDNIVFAVDNSSPCYLNFEWIAPISFSEIFQRSLFLRDLITIGVDTASTVTKLELLYSTGETKYVEVYSKKFDYSCCQRDSTSKSPYRIFFSYQDIGRLEGIEKWFKIAEKYEPSIRYLRSYWSNIFVENELTNMASAFEIWCRINGFKGKFNLKKNLAKYAVKFFERNNELSNVISKWSRIVAENRNALHNLHDHDYPLLAQIVESVYWLVVICIFQDMLSTEIVSSLKYGKLLPLISSLGGSYD